MDSGPNDFSEDFLVSLDYPRVLLHQISFLKLVKKRFGSAERQNAAVHSAEFQN